MDEIRRELNTQNDESANVVVPEAPRDVLDSIWRDAFLQARVQMLDQINRLNIANNQPQYDLQIVTQDKAALMDEVTKLESELELTSDQAAKTIATLENQAIQDRNHIQILESRLDEGHSQFKELSRLVEKILPMPTNETQSPQM